MVADHSTDFQRYLESVCSAYEHWWSFYTLTDALSQQQVGREKLRSPFDFGLMVQTVQPQSNKGETQEKTERLPVLEGLRKYASEHVLLVGRPGSGKSTALARLLLESAKQALQNSQNRIPVLVQLRQYKTSGTNESGVVYLIQDFLEAHDLLLEPADIRRLLFEKRFLLLVFRVTIDRWEAEAVLAEFLQGKVDYPPSRAKEWLEDLLKHHLIQVGSKNQIEFQHQLLQEYYAAECLLQSLPHLSDCRLKRDYLNYLKWTEPLALMLAFVNDEAEAVRVVKLALEVDLRLGARLAGVVKPKFQKQTVGLVAEQQISQKLKILLLGITRCDHAIDVPLQVLSNTSFARDLRESAAEALGKIGGESAVKALIEVLKQETYGMLGNSVLAGAMRALGEIGSESVVADLVEALNNGTLTIRNASPVLGKIASKSAVKALIKVLDVDDSCPIDFAAIGLDQISSEPAITALIEALKDKYYLVGSHAACRLGEIGSESALSVLINVLSHKEQHNSIRKVAASALGKIGGKSAVAVLINVLSHVDNDKHVRMRAAKLLGEIGSQLSVPALIEVLSHEYEDNYVRIHAIEALGKIGSESSVVMLIKVLKDEENDEIRNCAAEALGKIGGESVVAALIEVLSHKDEHKSVQISAAKALGEIGSELAVAALIKVLKDEDEYDYFRMRAAEALGKIGSELAVIALIDGLNDQNSVVRQGAASAMGKIGSESAVLVLIEALKDKNSRFHWEAIEALEKIGAQSAVPAMLKVLLDGGSNAGWRAAEALGIIGVPELLPSLSQLVLTTADNQTDKVLRVISGIQERCKYYNQVLATSPSPEEETNNAEPLSDTLNTLNQTLKTMSENPKYDFSGASFSGIVGSVTGNVEGNNIGTQYNKAKIQNLEEAATEKQQLLDLVALIAQGEGAELEFKSSAWWDIQKNKREKFNKRIIESIDAFLNSYRGGTLLIGVLDDDGSIVGIEYDYQRRVDTRKNRDVYENNLMSSLLGACGQDCGSCIQIAIENTEGKDVCRVTVHPSHRPVFIKDGQEEYFAIRAGNSNRKLNPRETNEYIKNRWKHY